MAMSQVLSVHFKLIIVHLFQIKPPRLRSEPRVRHLGKSLGVLRKVHWRSCGGQIQSSNLSWTLVKIQLTSSSLRLVRLERLPSSTVWTTAGYQSSYPFEHLHFAFIHKMNKTQKNTARILRNGRWNKWIHDSWFMINQKKDHGALVRFNPEFWNQKGLIQNILEDDDGIKDPGVPLGLYQSFRFSVCIHQVTFVSQKWGHALCAASAGQGDSATTTLVDWYVTEAYKGCKHLWTRLI